MPEIDRATESDLDQIADLSARSGLAFWSREDYAGAAVSQNQLLLVARSASKGLLGFILVRLLASGTGTFDIEVLNIAVEPDNKQRGIGTSLIRSALEQGNTNPESQVLLEVRASNYSAIGFYRRLGFKEQSIRPAYYREPVEDSILFGARAGDLILNISLGAKEDAI